VQTPFHYRDGELRCDGVPVRDIADEHGTPCYVYSAASLAARFGSIRAAFARWDALVCFSVKSCSNLSILKLLAAAGSGFDVVSGGELYRAVTAGADPQKIVFAGVGKTADEIRYALGQGILMFNVESRPEMARLNEASTEMGACAQVAVRVNPDVDAATHEKTTTGKADTKFGVGIHEAEQLIGEAAGWQGVQVRGVHVHLGSPIYSTEPHEHALEKVAGMIGRLRDAGHVVDCVNLGGGYCISYTGEQVIGPDAYARALDSCLERLGCTVIIEPGRYIAGSSGLLLTRVVYRKETEYGKRFIICDAAMNDLVRPTLYDAFHRIWPVSSADGMPAVMRPEQRELEGRVTEVVDVVGPVCETGDYLARDRPLPPVEEGDLLAVFDAGAYGFAMSSNYNSRPRCAEVLVEGAGCRVIRRRETCEDLVALERDYL